MVTGKQSRNRAAVGTISFVLQTIDLDPVILQILHLPEARHRLGGFGGGLTQRFRESDHLGQGLHDLVKLQVFGSGLDVVEHIVETRCQQVNVFAIERRDEGGVESPNDLMRDLVTLVLDIEQPPGLSVDVRVVLKQIDQTIGPLLNLHDDLRLAESTVDYYLTDHGIMLGEHGLMGKANSMLGKEIHAVPYVIRHPEGKRAGETSDYFASTHDVAPTMLSFQGLTVPGRMDGEDLTVMFEGADPPERAYWTTAYADHVAAGDGRWLLIADNQGKKRRLFDTEEDPDEEKDVAGENPDVVGRLWHNVLDDAGGTMPVFGETGVVSG